MRKFIDVYKQKLNEAEVLQENKVLDDFKKVYGALLDHYYIDKPKPRFYDYWDADIDEYYYNDNLTERLNEI